MKRLLYSFLSLSLALAFSSAIYAQAPTPAPQPNDQNQQPQQQQQQGQAQPPQQQGQAQQAQQNTTGQGQNQVIRGKILRTQGTDQIVIRTPENKEVILYATPEARYMVNNKAARFADLRVGEDVNAQFVFQNDRYVVSNFSIGGEVATIPPGGAVTPTESAVVEGTVVRLVGDDQVVVKTSTGQEVIVYVQPKTVYTLNGQQSRYTDLRPGAEIQVNYETRDRRNIAQTILDRVRRNK